MSEQAPPDGYLSSHLRGTKEGLGLTRHKYAMKAFTTFGASLPAVTGSTVCEIGPGECEFAELLVSRGHQVTIIDSSDEVVAVARTFGLDAVLTSDTTAWLTERPSTFDAVVMLHVLEHVPKPAIIPLLTAIRSSLRPGGALLLEVPNMGDPLNGSHARYADFTHEVGFTEESLSYVLRQAGFSAIGFLPAYGATGRVTRPAQMAGRWLLRAVLFVVNLPNGRQMRRNIGPVLAVRAEG
jgi:2-polyprenyl-3-methyl-5-hydroxy-6-metoxy-1,4-benzoquinol methylase